MFKKVLSFILILFLICESGIISAFSEESPWFMSSDGVAEVRIVSWEEATYPSYNLILEYRLNKNKTAQFTYSYNLSTFVASYVSENPAYKNRKIQISLSSGFNYFKLIDGTCYKINLPCIIGENMEATLTVSSVDLSVIFPDDFVNTDAIIAASGFKTLLSCLPYPSYYSTSDYFDLYELSVNGTNVYCICTLLTTKNNAGTVVTYNVWIVYNLDNSSKAIWLDSQKLYGEAIGFSIIPVWKSISDGSYTRHRTIPADSINKLL